jgi:hypothetical protein
MIKHSGGAIFCTCPFLRQTEKYENRPYKEAGWQRMLEEGIIVHCG